MPGSTPLSDFATSVQQFSNNLVKLFVVQFILPWCHKALRSARLFLKQSKVKRQPFLLIGEECQIGLHKFGVRINRYRCQTFVALLSSSETKLHEIF